MGLNSLWDVKQNPLSQAKRQAAIFNCPTDSSKQIADCLRTKDAHNIANTYENMLVSKFDATVTSIKIAINKVPQ